MVSEGGGRDSGVVFGWVDRNCFIWLTYPLGLSMATTAWSQVQDVLAGMPAGQRVCLRGWIYRTRSSGNIVFMTLRDVSGVIQVTVKKGNLPDAEFEAAKAALIESSVDLW